MTILNLLETASFREVRFSVSAETSTTGGRKKVVHEFINSDSRTVTDQGKLLKIFKVSGIITDSEGRYFERRDALIAALEKPDAGILSHPFFGKVSVVPDTYTLVESLGELGKATFAMNFYLAEDKIKPIADSFTAFNIEAGQERVVEFAGAEIIDKFKVDARFPFNFSAATNQLEAIAAVFDEVTTTFSRQLAEIDAFSQSLLDFRNSIRRLVNLPEELVASLNNLFDSVIALAATPEEAFLTLEKFFVFGDDAPLIPQTTFERIEKLRNRTLLNQYIQVGALAFAYNQAAGIDFFTIREIDVYAAKLDVQYQKVFSLITNVDLAAALSDLRGTTSEFLDIQRLNVKKIVDFETGPTTAQSLTYRLYGSVDDYERLVSLNEIKDADFVSGDLEVFR